MIMSREGPSVTILFFDGDNVSDNDTMRSPGDSLTLNFDL